MHRASAILACTADSVHMIADNTPAQNRRVYERYFCETLPRLDAGLPDERGRFAPTGAATGFIGYTPNLAGTANGWC